MITHQPALLVAIHAPVPVTVKVSTLELGERVAGVDGVIVIGEVALTVKQPMMLRNNINFFIFFDF
jgi:hypothetical protein